MIYYYVRRRIVSYTIIHTDRCTRHRGFTHRPQPARHEDPSSVFRVTIYREWYQNNNTKTRTIPQDFKTKISQRIIGITRPTAQGLTKRAGRPGVIFIEPKGHAAHSHKRARAHKHLFVYIYISNTTYMTRQAGTSR